MFKWSTFKNKCKDKLYSTDKCLNTIQHLLNKTSFKHTELFILKCMFAAHNLYK